MKNLLLHLTACHIRRAFNGWSDTGGFFIVPAAFRPRSFSSALFVERRQLLPQLRRAELVCPQSSAHDHGLTPVARLDVTEFLDEITRVVVLLHTLPLEDTHSLVQPTVAANFSRLPRGSPVLILFSTREAGMHIATADTCTSEVLSLSSTKICTTINPPVRPPPPPPPASWWIF